MKIFVERTMLYANKRDMHLYLYVLNLERLYFYFNLDLEKISLQKEDLDKYV